MEKWHKNIYDQFNNIKFMYCHHFMNQTCPSSKMVVNINITCTSVLFMIFEAQILSVPAVQTYALSLFKAGRNIIISNEIKCG